MTAITMHWIVTALQKAINYYLSLDPESARRLAQMQDKTVKIDLLRLNVQFYLFFSDKGVRVVLPEASHEIHPDTIISGTPLRLLQMSLSRENRKQFFADDVSIQGNLELGQQVTDLFDHIEIDWEEKLSHVVGDVSAHHVGRVFKRVKNWVKQTHDTFLQNATEYVHEEINLFPASEALKDYCQDVDGLRMDADRLEARVNLLKKSVNASRGGQ